MVCWSNSNSLQIKAIWTKKEEELLVLEKSVQKELFQSSRNEASQYRYWAIAPSAVAFLLLFCIQLCPHGLLGKQPFHSLWKAMVQIKSAAQISVMWVGVTGAPTLAEWAVLWFRRHQKTSPTVQTRRTVLGHIFSGTKGPCLGHVFLGANSTSLSWDLTKLQLLQLHTCTHTKAGADCKSITSCCRYVQPPEPTECSSTAGAAQWWASLEHGPHSWLFLEVQRPLTQHLISIMG